MNEHNPITMRLEEMANVWKQNVQPHHTLVRWMLKPEENRMYEGFCRVEASPHGRLDNLFLFFYTHLTTAKTYSYEIIEQWLREYDDPKQRSQYTNAGITTEWDLQAARKAVADQDYEACHRLLPEMTRTYREWVNMPNATLVLALLPKQMSGVEAFQEWINGWMEQPRPPATQLLVFDHLGSNYWGQLFEHYKNEAVSLLHDLRMQDAVRQIATAGSATDPYAFFRKCMFEMADASVKKDQPLLEAWGEKGIEAAKKCGDKNLLGTAYITYAGMLFGFKDHPAIERLLDTGIRLCKQEIASGKDIMKPLLLQFYTYQGANLQLQHERKDALTWFLKAGDEAVAFGLPGQAVSAYYKAFVFAEYKNYPEEKLQARQSALPLGSRLTPEEIQASEYPFMAHDLFLDNDAAYAILKEQVNQVMIAAYGENWQETVEELKQNYTKQRIREAEAGSPAVALAKEGPATE